MNCSDVSSIWRTADPPSALYIFLFVKYVSGHHRNSAIAWVFSTCYANLRLFVLKQEQYAAWSRGRSDRTSLLFNWHTGHLTSATITLVRAVNNTNKINTQSCWIQVLFTILPPGGRRMCVSLFICRLNLNYSDCGCHVRNLLVPVYVIPTVSRFAAVCVWLCLRSGSGFLHRPLLALTLK